MKWHVRLPESWRFLLNRYWITSLAFACWMAFFDSNSLLIQWELSREIDRMEEGIAFYTKALENDRQRLEELESKPQLLEKFAREQYWMCKADEEVFLVEWTEE